MYPTPQSQQVDPIADDVARISRIPVVGSILDVVSRVTGMGFAAIARVTDDRWVACAVRDDIAFGIEPGGELEANTTICQMVRQHGEMVVIDHVAEDEVFCSHPTPQRYGFQSYISVPIRRPDGVFFGTLCALDPKPADLHRAEVIETFRLFADLLGFHLHSQDQLEEAEDALAHAERTGNVRDQFIAVLGHDLRNPLAAIGAAGELLATRSLDETATRSVAVLRRSVQRMSRLVEDVMDFARGRLGGGIPVTRSEVTHLAEVLRGVAEELREGRPGRAIEVDLAIEGPVYCDPDRVAQLLSNLMANALDHGSVDGVVSVQGMTCDEALTLHVTNDGALDPEARPHLFRPFERGRTHSGAQGLGLGLFIANEIARAHGGSVSVDSADDRTRFTLRIPRANMSH